MIKNYFHGKHFFFVIWANIWLLESNLLSISLPLLFPAKPVLPSLCNIVCQVVIRRKITLCCSLFIGSQFICDTFPSFWSLFSSGLYVFLFSWACLFLYVPYRRTMGVKGTGCFHTSYLLFLNQSQQKQGRCYCVMSLSWSNSSAAGGVSTARMGE